MNYEENLTLEDALNLVETLHTWTNPFESAYMASNEEIIMTAQKVGLFYWSKDARVRIELHNPQSADIGKFKGKESYQIYERMEHKYEQMREKMLEEEGELRTKAIRKIKRI